MTEQNPIDTRPDWLRSVQAEGTGIQTITVDGKSYPYTLVRTGLSPLLPYVLGFNDESTLFVSINTAEKDRPHFLAHEIREKTKFADLPEGERCPASLEAELNDVQAAMSEDFSMYVLERKLFFDALLNFYSDPVQAQAVTPEFIQGLNSSRDYLSGLSMSL